MENLNRDEWPCTYHDEKTREEIIAMFNAMLNHYGHAPIVERQPAPQQDAGARMMNEDGVHITEWESTCPYCKKGIIVSVYDVGDRDWHEVDDVDVKKSAGGDRE